MKNNNFHHEKQNHDDENDSLFSELRMSSVPSSQFSQNDAKLPPPYVHLFSTTDVLHRFEF